MRFILKIVAAPFVLALSVLWAVMAFVFGVASGLLEILCGFGVLLSIVFFCAGMTPNGIFFLVLSFLISPVGLPLIADGLIKIVASMNGALITFITT